MTSTQTPTQTPAPRPARMNPRIRDRRIEVQREAGRRRLRVLLVVSSVLSAIGIAFLIVTSPVLDVDHIPVAGAQHVTAAQVRTASGVHNRDHLLFVDTGTVARRVERLPWVEHATVHRELPGTLSIAVTEYTPAAYVRTAGGVVLVAANGHVIADASVAPAHTVEVRGVRKAPGVGELLAPPDAAGVVGRLPVALAQQVVAIDVSGSGVALVLAGDGQIRLGTTAGLDAKAASAQAVLAHLGPACFVYVDVSTPDRPISQAC
jgi:cell division protein FtsQ